MEMDGYERQLNNEQVSGTETPTQVTPVSKNEKLD